MIDPISRRDFVRLAGVAGAGAVLPTGSATAPLAQNPAILPLTSSSEVFVPPRGNAFQKFSFDFPEPSVEFAGLRFGFLVFTRENVYGLDAARIGVETGPDVLNLTCGGFVWAGGQERAAGRLIARFRKSGTTIEWDVTVEMSQPVKTVTSIVRGLPRGKLSAGGGAPFDPHDDEVLWGYPFGAGDLFGGNTAWGLGTPLVSVQAGEREVWSVSSLDDQVRAKRFYFQPGERGYKLEAVFEAEGWRDQPRLVVPTWRLVRTATLEEATALHYAHLERVYALPAFETRPDAPPWLSRIKLVLALHGAHYTGYLFNDYARMLEILRWVAPRIPPAQVLVFLAAWDGRYYWNYPRYRADERMGGEAGLRRLVDEGHRLGFRFMPMFGMNAANKRLPEFEQVADAATSRIDGNRLDLDWVDWDNDRHQEGWLAYMNLGVPSWRQWLGQRIADVVERYGVDAYFLDIAGGWIDNPRADMHEGTRLLVEGLRARYPHVLACGEMHYDALLALFPLFQVYSPHATKYVRFFSHLSSPAPGRGSTGVHEAGFGRFDPATLNMRRGPIPTITVVDDTFTQHQDLMAAAIARALELGGTAP